MQENNRQIQNGFFIPLCKTQAKEILLFLGKKDFDKQIRETLYNETFTEQELREYLNMYRGLTKVDYIQQMLQEENYQNHNIFETFAEKNFLDPRQIIKELLTKGEGKVISEWEEPEKKEVWLYSFLYRRNGYGFKISDCKTSFG